jgi:hypothetical protein
MLEQTERSLDGGTLVIRDIIHHQNHPASWILFHQKVFDELNKELAVLPISHLPADLIIIPTISTEKVTVLFGTWL